jgi:hypothetical protein
MAYSDLNATQKAMVSEFLRDLRAAMADTVRGLRTQQLLLASYTNTIGTLWAQIGASDVVPDETGLAGADKEMTKTDWTPILTWCANLLAGIYSDNGGAVATAWPAREVVDAYGVQVAGPTNL